MRGPRARELYSFFNKAVRKKELLKIDQYALCGQVRQALISGCTPICHSYSYLTRTLALGNQRLRGELDYLLQCFENDAPAYTRAQCESTTKHLQSAKHHGYREVRSRLMCKFCIAYEASEETVHPSITEQ